MYKCNQIVEVEGVYGRVIYHDPVTHIVHVLLRTNFNTWKIQKCDDLHCKPVQVFLWTIESAFCTKYSHRTRTPQFEAMRVDQDCIMDF